MSVIICKVGLLRSFWLNGPVLLRQLHRTKGNETKFNFTLFDQWNLNWKKKKKKKEKKEKKDNYELILSVFNWICIKTYGIRHHNEDLLREGDCPQEKHNIDLHSFQYWLGYINSNQATPVAVQ